MLETQDALNRMAGTTMLEAQDAANKLYNAWLAQQAGGGGSSSLASRYSTTDVQTADYNATPWQIVRANPSAAAFAVRLPTGTISGDSVIVRRETVGGTNAVNVVTQGTDVIGTGSTTSFPINLDAEAVTFVSNGAGRWTVAEGHKGLPALDNRYATTYNVKNYGAVGDGTTNDRPAIAAAYAAATATGGVVYLPPGTYNLTTGIGAGCINWVPNGTTRVTVRGAGKGATTIKLNSTCKFFATVDGANGNTVTYRGLGLEDFTVNGNNVTNSGGQSGILFHMGTKANVDGLYIRRVDGINCGQRNISTNERRFIDVTCYGVQRYDSTLYTLTDIIVEDCNIGMDGSGGSNYGVLIQGYISGTDAAIPNPILWRCNVFMDRIYINRCNWWSGASGSASSVWSSCGFMVGGNGWGNKVRFRDLYAKGSADDNYEVDGILDFVADNCVSEDCTTEGFAFIANTGWSDRQTHTFNNCRHTGSGGDGFMLLSSGNFTTGSMIFRNCYIEGPSGTTRKFRFEGRFRELTMENCKARSTGTLTPTANSQYIQQYPIFIVNQGESCVVNIDNFRWVNEMDHNTTGFSGTSIAPSVVNMASIPDVTLNIRNVVYEARGSRLNTGNNYNGNLSMLIIGSGGTYTTRTDDFSNSRVDNYLKIDNTAYTTDLAIVSQVMTVVANPTVEKRARWDYNSSSVNDRGRGPLKDQAIWAKYVPGSTLAGFKGGMMVKWNTKVGGLENFVDGYVTDDGTNSYLCLDKVIQGVRTSLLGTIVDGGAGTISTIASPQSYQSDRGIRLATRIASGTAYRVRTKAADDVVSVDYYDSTTPTRANAGSVTASYTVTAADAPYFGPNIMGFGGFTWCPMDLTATLDDVTQYATWIIRGTIDGVRVIWGELNSNNTQIRAVETDSTTVRIDGLLNITNTDFAQARYMSTAPVVITGQDAAMLRKIRFGNNTLPIRPLPTSLTVGASPYTYTNGNQYTTEVTITNGMVSDASLSFDGGTTFTTVAGSTGCTVPVQPGDQLKVTYTTVPYMRVIPRR